MSAPRVPGHPPTPELDKMTVAREEGHSEDIGAFLEWLAEQGLHLARYEADGRWRPAHEGIQNLLAKYFHIDLVKVDQERMALLQHIRGERG